MSWNEHAGITKWTCNNWYMCTLGNREHERNDREGEIRGQMRFQNSANECHLQVNIDNIHIQCNRVNKRQYSLCAFIYQLRWVDPVWSFDSKISYFIFVQ